MENQKNNNNKQQYNSGLNKTLYTGMNGKPVTLWKFILGIILILGGTFIAINVASNLGIYW